MTLMLIDSCSCLSFSRLSKKKKRPSKKQLSLNYKIAWLGRAYWLVAEHSKGIS